MEPMLRRLWSRWSLARFAARQHRFECRREKQPTAFRRCRCRVVWRASSLGYVSRVHSAISPRHRWAERMVHQTANHFRVSNQTASPTRALSPTWNGERRETHRTEMATSWYRRLHHRGRRDKPVAPQSHRYRLPSLVASRARVVA